MKHVVDVWGSGFQLTWWMSCCTTDLHGVSPLGLPWSPAHCTVHPLQQAGLLFPFSALPLGSSALVSSLPRPRLQDHWLLPPFFGVAILLPSPGILALEAIAEAPGVSELSMPTPPPIVAPPRGSQPIQAPCLADPPPKIQHNPQVCLVVSSFRFCFLFVCFYFPHSLKLTSYD